MWNSNEQGIINYNIVEDSDDEELEALLVVRDRGKGQADVSTNLDQEEDDGDLVWLLIIINKYSY